MSVQPIVKRESPAKVLPRVLEAPGIHQGPVVYDGLSAMLVEKAGFPYCFTGGFHIAAARYGLPDTDIVSYGETVDQGRQVTEAVSIPVIGDADDGFGNAMMLKRSVRGFIKAGFGGVMIDDQVSVKAAGEGPQRKVVSKEEAVMRIKAAVDARSESGTDIVIVRRTDARLAVSFEEALWRMKTFADAGADVIFLDNLFSKDEMKAFCNAVPHVPKLANMGEDGGTPFPNPEEMASFGYKLVAYPFCLLGASILAIQDALAAIKGGGVPGPGKVPSLEKLKEILGFHVFYEEEKRYIV
ncbi:uncharacterized protein LOC21387651 [Morus notabilis]|uniref:uncharacterized protein LOC21387651 n=1 Tax=Morus notabilis TaxID=981085 RepID=UPI000CED0C8B|nr:uncharacterized protein LOC21387651 [Morus notabilis]